MCKAIKVTPLAVGSGIRPSLVIKLTFKETTISADCFST